MRAISADDFLAGVGHEGWHVQGAVASAVFDTRNFSTGIALVNRIADLAEEANHHPDVHISYASVAVTLMTHDVGGLTEKDVSLARQVSEAAAELGVTVATDS